MDPIASVSAVPEQAAPAQAVPEQPESNAGTRSMVWSFLLPPIGALMGGWVWCRGRVSAEERTRAKIAVANGMFGTIVIWKVIAWGPGIVRWVLTFYE